MHTDLATAVRAWIDDDPDSETALHLTDLLDLLDLAGDTNDDETMRTAARAELADRFAGFLEFGTAGLRGALGGGPNRMNRAVVIRTAAGLVRYLTDTLGPDSRPVVVIGYDARHMSDSFARDTAAVRMTTARFIRLGPPPSAPRSPAVPNSRNPANRSASSARAAVRIVSSSLVSPARSSRSVRCRAVSGSGSSSIQACTAAAKSSSIRSSPRCRRAAG